MTIQQNALRIYRRDYLWSGTRCRLLSPHYGFIRRTSNGEYEPDPFLIVKDFPLSLQQMVKYVRTLRNRKTRLISRLLIIPRRF